MLIICIILSILTLFFAFLFFFIFINISNLYESYKKHIQDIINSTIDYHEDYLRSILQRELLKIERSYYVMYGRDINKDINKIEKSTGKK